MKKYAPFLAFQVAEKISVLVIAPGANNRFLRAALEGLGVFAADFRSSQGIDYSSLSNYQMIILRVYGAENRRHIRS